MKKLVGILAVMVMGFAFAETVSVRPGEELNFTPKACVENKVLVKSIYRGSDRVGKIVMDISTEKGISEIEYYLSKGSVVELYEEVEQETDEGTALVKTAAQFKVSVIRDNYVELKKIEKKAPKVKPVVEDEVSEEVESESDETEAVEEQTEEAAAE